MNVAQLKRLPACAAEQFDNVFPRLNERGSIEAIAVHGRPDARTRVSTFE